MSHTSLPEDDGKGLGKNSIKDENDPIQTDPQRVMEILQSENVLESPIDINITRTVPVKGAQPLTWVNYELPPKKMKITNTGHTVILSGKWGQERPYITNGTLTGKYVFSQMHLHWGVNDMEGSEHTIDGCQYPGEMHVVMFKSSYLTQESALKEADGVVILVYIFRTIVDALPGIVTAHTSTKIAPAQLGFLMRQFDSDYFMYRGAVSTDDCVHHITWLITRVPLGVARDQIDSLRFLLDNNDGLIRRNFREVQPMESRHVFHILPSSSKYSTLLPIPDLDAGEKPVTQIYMLHMFNNHEQENIYGNIKKKKKLENINKSVVQNSDILIDQMLCVIDDIRKYINAVFYIVGFIYIYRYRFG